ncbi:MAG: cellulase family glycosylhydrolase [Draconibacterium sp.]
MGLGKKYFPGINTVRYWLSFDAFAVEQKGFCENFETALSIANQHGLKVIPTLYNNWHSIPGFGGISEEMLRYWFVDYGKKGTASNYVFRPFVEKIVGDHAEDERILARDLCNEPHNNGNWKLILEWLTRTYNLCKEFGAKQPVSVNVQNQVQSVNEISDLFMIHPYFAKSEKLNEIVAFAQQQNKGVLATECCWGSLDDKERVQHIVNDCCLLSHANIGFMPHALHESPVGDLHHEKYGILSSASSMHFIEMDGALRPGHEVFNLSYIEIHFIYN